MNFWSTVLGGSKDGNSSSCTTAKTSSGAEAGSGVSEDGGVSFGFSLLQGKRPNMEDFHHAAFQREPRSGQQCGFFGIFDGHGGPNAADFVRQNLFVNLLKNPQIQNDVHAAIVEAYVETDTQYLRQDASSGRDDGCTAVIAVVMGKRLLVANVGDSRAVLSRKGKAVAMSEDHKPNLPSERQRIENAGGVVVWAGTWRVSGVLAVSRAFGDRPLKRYVVAMPDIKEEAITKDDEFLVLASDGVWDVVSNQEAVSLLRDIPDADKAAKKLSEEAFSRGSNDNISCIVIRFHPGKW